jgi:hypothetical protein
VSYTPLRGDRYRISKSVIILAYSAELKGSVMTHTIVGVDIAKNVMQVHWVDQETGEIVNRPVKRAAFLEYFANRNACLIGMESCSGSQHWPGD